jgi:hypothetical protein
MVVLKKITDPENHEHTTTRSVKMVVDDSQATISEMIDAYEEFLLCIGYNFAKGSIQYCEESEIV